MNWKTEQMLKIQLRGMGLSEGMPPLFMQEISRTTDSTAHEKDVHNLILPTRFSNEKEKRACLLGHMA